MKISLTFDNGPTPGITDPVLDVLAGKGIKAAFLFSARTFGTKPDAIW